MELEELDLKMHDLGAEPTAVQMNMLWLTFKEHFIDKPFEIDGLPVKVHLAGSRVSGYEGYAETFVHLITRKSNSGKRVFDRERANRLHWIRCILENRKHEDVAYFLYPEPDGRMRAYFWYREGDFLVIVEEISSAQYIITSFHIDDRRNRDYFEKRMWWWKNQRKG